MKFSCNQQSLSKALNIVSKAVTIRTTIPILKGILLKVEENGKLTLSASDLDLSIEKNIDVNVIEEGSIVVNAKLFSDIIRKLPNEEINIEVTENETILIKTLSSEFNIAGQQADEFPSIGEIEDAHEKISFNKEIFKSMIKKTAFSASIDESKGIIVGVLLELEENYFNMAALDGFRMAVTREPMKNENSTNIIISSRILGEINKIMTDVEEEESIDLILGNKKAVILMERTKIVIRLMEGEFIKYKDILPKENNTKIIIDKGMLIDSIERASLLAKEGKNNLIKCTVTENLLSITSTSEEGNVKEEIIMEKTGSDLEIGFNSKYILDALKAIEDKEILMELNTAVTPCIIKPIDGNAYEYLILPVRINLS